jgi:hypothetical protein
MDRKKRIYEKEGEEKIPPNLVLTTGLPKHFPHLFSGPPDC